MDTYLVSLAVIGAAVLGMAWMPFVSQRIKISYAIIYVLAGMLLYALLGPWLPSADPLKFEQGALRLAELVVIVSIMGTGLKIDQPFSFKTWRVPFRLISVTMLLCIGAMFCLGYFVLGLNAASSLLLGAVLAPTDPVLANDVQVGPPLEKSRDNVRFALTAEAGMNDGMAFPFTWLSISLAMMSVSKTFSLGRWLAYDLLYRIAAGVIIGYVLGRLLAYLVFHLPERRKFVVVTDGFVGIATTLMVYGLTELVHGYGFIAVFVAAITLRNSHLHHHYHTHLHDFTDQVERILVAIILLLFGGSLVTGILQPLTWPMVAVSLLFVLVVRPLTGLLSLADLKLHVKEKMAISFFGIRGMGSFFYLAFACSQYFFVYQKELWAMVSFIVLLSVIVHGFTATRVMDKITTRFSEDIDSDGQVVDVPVR